MKSKDILEVFQERGDLDAISAWSCSSSQITIATKDAKPIAKGAFGAVYKVFLDSTPCAAKKLKKVTAQSVRGLVNEARVLSTLSHPGIVRLIGVCLEPDSIMCLLEYADRGSLDKVLTRSDITFASHILQMLGQAAQALSFVHSSGLIHMDVKSANILVREDWSVAWGDFGEIECLEETREEKEKGGDNCHGEEGPSNDDSSDGAGDKDDKTPKHENESFASKRAYSYLQAASKIQVGSPYYVAPEITKGERRGQGMFENF